MPDIVDRLLDMAAVTGVNSLATLLTEAANKISEIRTTLASQANRLAKLDALEAGGVDNWEWYDDSLKDWYASQED